MRNVNLCYDSQLLPSALKKMRQDVTSHRASSINRLVHHSWMIWTVSQGLQKAICGSQGGTCPEGFKVCYRVIGIVHSIGDSVSLLNGVVGEGRRLGPASVTWLAWNAAQRKPAVHCMETCSTIAGVTMLGKLAKLFLTPKHVVQARKMLQSTRQAHEPVRLCMQADAHAKCTCVHICTHTRTCASMQLCLRTHWHSREKARGNIEVWL